MVRPTSFLCWYLSLDDDRARTRRSLQKSSVRMSKYVCVQSSFVFNVESFWLNHAQKTLSLINLNAFKTIGVVRKVWARGKVNHFWSDWKRCFGRRLRRPKPFMPRWTLRSFLLSNAGRLINISHLLLCATDDDTVAKNADQFQRVWELSRVRRRACPSPVATSSSWTNSRWEKRGKKKKSDKCQDIFIESQFRFFLWRSFSVIKGWGFEWKPGARVRQSCSSRSYRCAFEFLHSDHTTTHSLWHTAQTFSRLIFAK